MSKSECVAWAVTAVWTAFMMIIVYRAQARAAAERRRQIKLRLYEDYVKLLRAVRPYTPEAYTVFCANVRMLLEEARFADPFVAHECTVEWGAQWSGILKEVSHGTESLQGQ